MGFLNEYMVAEGSSGPSEKTRTYALPRTEKKRGRGHPPGSKFLSRTQGN